MVVQGRHERELRPPLDVDKGTVVRALVAEHDAQAASLQTAPPQTAPPQTAPPQTAPPQTAPAQTAPARTAPARVAPLQAAAAFGDDVGDLPAFAALGDLAAPHARDGSPLTVVRVAAVDTESPASVAAAADLTVPGATGAVALLRELADAAGASPAVQS